MCDVSTVFRQGVSARAKAWYHLYLHPPSIGLGVVGESSPVCQSLDHYDDDDDDNPRNVDTNVLVLN